MSDYRVDLNVYNGPLDLLLFLIQREEMDIYDISISRITEQYVSYIRLMEEIDPNLAGDYLVMLATLMEIKSRMLLPTPPPAAEEDETDFDPRRELVRQLLEYKRFKDAAMTLGEQASEHAQRFSRLPPDAADAEAGEVDIEDAQIWDLMAAFRRLMEQTGRTVARHEVVYDDTPVTLHAQDLLDRLQREGGSLAFEIIFIGRTRSEMIGLFLALLECIRQKRVRFEQEKLFGQIIVHLIDATPITQVSVLGLQTLAAASEEMDDPADRRDDDDAVALVDNEQPFNVDEDDEELAKLDDALKAADAVNKDIENDPGRTTS